MQCKRANTLILIYLLLLALGGVPRVIAAPSGLRVYAVAASFYTVRDTVTWSEVKARWSGNNSLPIAVELPTYYELREKLGPSSAAQIVTGDPVNWAWKHPEAWLIVPFERLSPRYKVLQIEGFDIFRSLEKYPLAFDSQRPNYAPDKITTIALSGVTALTRGTGDMIDQNSPAWAVKDIRTTFSNVDFAHTSNEVSFSKRCLHPGAQQTFGAFCSKENYFDVLTKAGINVIELTGNHNNDYGYDDALHSLDLYKKHNIQTFGGGADQPSAESPLIITHNANRFAFIGCNSAGPKFAWATATTPGAARCDMHWLQPILSDASISVKILSVQYTEYDQAWPVEDHRAFFRSLAEAGASVVIGSQSHRPQTFSFEGNRFIHYGLGNLFFDQTELQQRKFFIDEVTLYQGKLINVTLVTGIIEDQARPRLMTPEERKKFLSTMFYLSQTTNKPT